MNSPYENIVIGNFLYGLGLAMGRQPEAVEGCINLLQQTPLDRPFGDVLVHYPGVLCLLEFKRDEADWRKERTKLKLMRMAMRDHPNLQAVSRDVHWFVRIDRLRTCNAVEDIPIVVSPYLDLDEREVGNPAMSLADLTGKLVVEAAGSMRHSYRRMHTYLQAVATFSNVRGLRAPGLLVSVSAAGGIHYVGLENIADLRLTGADLVQRWRTREMRIQAAISLAREHENERRRALEHSIDPPKRTRTRSMGLER